MDSNDLQTQTPKISKSILIKYLFFILTIIFTTSFITTMVITYNRASKASEKPVDTDLIIPTTSSIEEIGYSFDDLNSPSDSEESPAITVNLNSHFGFKSPLIANAKSFGRLTYYKRAKFYELYLNEKWGNIYLEYIYLDNPIDGLPKELQGTFSGYENYTNTLVPRPPLADSQPIDSFNPSMPLYWKIIGNHKSFEQPQYCHHTDYEKITDQGYGYLEICIPFSKFTSFDEEVFYDSSIRYLEETINGTSVIRDNPQMPWLSNSDADNLRREINKISSSFSL